MFVINATNNPLSNMKPTKNEPAKSSHVKRISHLFLCSLGSVCSALPISALPGHLASANKWVTGSLTETDDTYLLQLQGNDEEG